MFLIDENSFENNKIYFYIRMCAEKREKRDSILETEISASVNLCGELSYLFGVTFSYNMYTNMATFLHIKDLGDLNVIPLWLTNISRSDKISFSYIKSRMIMYIFCFYSYIISFRLQKRSIQFLKICK